MPMADPSSPASWHKLLVCTDGSPASQGALRAAHNLARTFGSRVWLLEVMQFIPGFAGLSPEFVFHWHQEVEQRLNALQAAWSHEGLSLTPLVRQSASAAAAIVQEARELEPGLIVMGRHGQTGLARLLMGSVTARVIGESPVNVLAVPREARLAWGRLLVASDGSAFSDAAFAEALDLARSLNSTLLAVTVVRENEYPEAQAILDRLLAQANRRGLPLTTLLVEGAPDDAIVQAAGRHAVDLIILGSHGRTGFTRLLMGSTAERVIGAAAGPVLVVKKREEG
ncbi:MAG: universal stress protein [Deltaproteobacteria bacterium]|nr:universal stress protein [Deltaproteobacteria bacterium]